MRVRRIFSDREGLSLLKQQGLVRIFVNFERISRRFRNEWSDRLLQRTLGVSLPL